MSKIFIFGSRSIRELPDEAVQVLRTCIEKGCQVLVGDAPGVDTLVQLWFHEHGYLNVRVYHLTDRCRTNFGFPYAPVKGHFQWEKDLVMQIDCTAGLAIWDGQSSGTSRNIRNLGIRKKKVKVIKPNTSFVPPERRQYSDIDERIQQSGFEEPLQNPDINFGENRNPDPGPRTFVRKARKIPAIVNLKTTRFDPKTMVYVGRRKDCSQHFGNPFGFRGAEKGCAVILSSREEAVHAYRDWLLGTKWSEIEPDRRQFILGMIPQMHSGVILACYCAPEICHAAVIADLVADW